jgi:hypothetical protein
MKYLKIVCITVILGVAGIVCYNNYDGGKAGKGKSGIMFSGGCLVISFDADENSISTGVSFLQNLGNEFVLPNWGKDK